MINKVGDSNAMVLVVAIITSGLNWRTRHNLSTSKWRFKNNSVRLIKKEIKRTRLMRHNLQSQERAYDVTTYKVKNEANTSQLTTLSILINIVTIATSHTSL